MERIVLNGFFDADSFVSNLVPHVECVKEWNRVKRKMGGGIWEEEGRTGWKIRECTT